MECFGAKEKRKGCSNLESPEEVWVGPLGVVCDGAIRQNHLHSEHLHRGFT